MSHLNSNINETFIIEPIFSTGSTPSIISYAYNPVNNTFTITDSTGVTFNAIIQSVSGLTINGTLSAATYFGLPRDIFVTGGTYSNSTATFTNNTGGTFSVTGFTSSAATIYTSNGTLTGNRTISLSSFTLTFGNTNNYKTFFGGDSEENYSAGTQQYNFYQGPSGCQWEIKNNTHIADIIIEPNNINIQSSTLGYGTFSSIVISNDEIGLYPSPFGNLSFNFLRSLSAQTGTTRLIGQASPSGNVGFVGIGSGLMLSGDTLTASTIYNSDGSLTTNRFLNLNSKTLRFFDTDSFVDFLQSGHLTYFTTDGGDNYGLFNTTNTELYGEVVAGANTSTFQVNPVSVNLSLDTTGLFFTSSSFDITLGSANFRILNLVNDITQSRLIGQNGTNSRVGYINIGSGLVLSGGTLSATSVEVFVTGGTYTAGTATFTNNTGGTFSVSGFSTSYAVTTVTAATHNETISSGELIILADTISNNITINLPSAIGNTAKITIKRISSGGNTLVIDGNATETIDGALTTSLAVQYESIALISDNVNWFII